MNIITLILLFVSVIIGAMIVEIFTPKRSKNIHLLLTFSGAYLLAISLLHLLPELFKYNTTENIGLYILGGFLIQILLEYFSQGIEHGHFHKSNVIPLSVLISLCLHALLEGVPLGGELEKHTHNTLLYGIVLHNSRSRMASGKHSRTGLQIFAEHPLGGGGGCRETET